MPGTPAAMDCPEREPEPKPAAPGPGALGVPMPAAEAVPSSVTPGRLMVLTSRTGRPRFARRRSASLRVLVLSSVMLGKYLPL